MIRRTNSRIAVALLGMSLALPLVGCKRNAATGELQFNYFSRDQEIALGLESKTELVPAYGGEVADASVRAYVTEIGESMTPYIEEEYRDLPWSFTILDSDVINAFALPGGQVFVSRGLAELLDDEAELAGVIGHEIGHVTAEHVDQRMGRQMILAGLAVGVSAAANESETQWAQAAAGLAISGAGVYSLSFDRAQEIESDKLGMRYMERAKYDPSAIVGVMETLRDASGGGGQPEFLATHPHPETRIERIRERMENKKYRETQGNPAYVRNRDAYERRMLRPLALLPTPPDSAFASLFPNQYCMVCAARGLSE